jgi:glycosyltransferase involved in cell wall biosynthesis
MLVTCIMPTADRCRFVPAAIEYFRRQDYPERELVIARWTGG